MRPSLRHVAVGLVAFAPMVVSAGCGSDAPRGDEGAEQVPPSSETIGPRGGVVTSADGATIEIPEGALDREVVISITKLETAPPFALGAGYRMAPDGLTFLKPVVLTFPFTPPPPDRTEPIVIVTTPTGKEEWASLGGTLVDPTHVRATTTHFSDAAATFSPVAWLASGCAQGVLAAGGFNASDPMFASLRPLDTQRVCSGGSRASTYAECMYHCDRCNSAAWFGGFPALLSEINTWGSATLNLGGQASRAVDALSGFVDKLIKMYVEWCIPYRRQNPVMGWSAKAWCEGPANLASFMGDAAKVGAYVGIAVACLEALNNAAMEVGRAVGLSGRDYGYLNDAWYESLSLVACSVINAANTCGGLGAQPSGPAAATTGFQGLTNFVSGNPYFNAATLACGTAVACRSEALCEVTGKACAYYDQVATRPAPGFTPETGYDKDGFCCCSNGGDPAAAGTWSVIEEHRCLDTGKRFHPGTCGPRTKDDRVAQGMPTTPEECATYAKGPEPRITGNAWGTLTCRHKVSGANCITYTIGHCADQSAYGAACSEGGINGSPPVVGPRECSQDPTSTTYRCLHNWCAYGCIPGNSPPGSHDDNWEPVYTCVDNPSCD